MGPVNWHTFFFLLFAMLATGFGAAVVLTTNVVRMAFHLILSLAATSVLFFLAGAEFVGAMQLMIYVGGTLVLLVFGVMLTAQSPFVNLKTKAGDWVLAAIVAGSLMLFLAPAAFSVKSWRAPPRSEPTTLARPDESGALGLALVGVRTEKLGKPAAESRGLAGYLLPFEIVSVHLLVVLVGAAYLARAKKRATPAQAA